MERRSLLIERKAFSLIKHCSRMKCMELVTVDEWQRSMKPLSTEQRAKVTKKTVVRPGERCSMIRRVDDQRRFLLDSHGHW